MTNDEGNFDDPSLICQRDCKTVIYMDGGSQRHRDITGSFVLSWGLVAHHNDETYERYGCLNRCPPFFEGSHEKLAFIEAVRFADGINAAPENVFFITDDSSVCDANRMYHKYGNLVRSASTVEKIAEVCNAYFHPGLKELCIKFLQKSSFMKVKGHSRRTVYNLRCDHLARYARNWEYGDISPLLTFEEWLHDGALFNEKKIKRTWYVPFSEMDFLREYEVMESGECLEEI